MHLSAGILANRNVAGTVIAMHLSAGILANRNVGSAIHIFAGSLANRNVVLARRAIARMEASKKTGGRGRVNVRAQTYNKHQAERAHGKS
jgi:hypothetical protein